MQTLNILPNKSFKVNEKQQNCYNILMDTQYKTFYLWDLADTLFSEQWAVQKTGLANYDAYVESLGYNLKTVDAKTYETSYERPYKDELFELSLMPGFIETLSWTKHNAAFTTGVPEQTEWRAETLLKKGQPNILPFFKKIYTTFDYGNTNQKTTAMLLDILNEISEKGYSTIVYADNKLENCIEFKNAADQIPQISYRLYHINIGSGFKQINSNFFEAPGLLELLKNEKQLL